MVGSTCAFAVVLCVACAGDDGPAPGSSDPSSGQPATTPEAAAPPRTAPHGSSITLLAVADTGDAAFTADRFHQLRLWPSLDGKREPVVVSGAQPRQLALARDRDGWLAAMIDTAGGLVLVRLSADGGQRGRAVVAPDPGFDQIVAISGGLLAKRRDHHVVRFDARGRELGTLRLPAGELVFALHARRDAALVVIAPRAPSKRTVLRRIELAGASPGSAGARSTPGGSAESIDTIRWGATIELPVEVTSTFALSPSGNRAAGVVGDGRVALFDLAATPPAIVRERRVGVPDPRFVAGFLDETRAFLPHGIVTTDAFDRPIAGDGSGLAVVGDNIVVRANDTGLQLGDGKTTRYLGYQALGWDHLGRSNDAFVHHIGNTHGGDHLIWLDDQLRTKRIAEVPGAPQRFYVDDRRVLLALPDPIDSKKPVWTEHLALYDVTTNSSRTLIEGWQQGLASYDATSHVIATAATPVSPRYRVDPATAKLTPLASLKTPGPISFVVVDPALAEGVVALGISGGLHVTYLEYFVDTGKDPIESEPRFRIAGREVGNDRAGRLYTVDDAGTLRIYRRNEPLRTLDVGPQYKRLSVHPTGDFFAIITSTELVVYDPSGTERWRIPTWNAERPVISPSGKTIAVSTYGGLLAYDAADGKLVGSACAWGFGLRAEDPTYREYHVPAVCE